jgi:lipopolysaccharide/colanic/teichoic acid biosynthesis glycosyltransferase
MIYSITKRIIDVVGSVVLGMIFFPACLVTALAIRIDSMGPVFADVPERVGKNGTPFRLFKFRSMVQDAHRLLRTDPQMKDLYDKYKKSSYKLKHDPRITRVGRFIRKHSIDEIPQLINVLRGEMSLVGPRPYYFDELAEQQRKYPHTKKLVNLVLKVKPGITGHWQVSGRSEVHFDKRIAMDAEYVRKRSVCYDLFILFKTPWAMITGRGAH